MLVSETPGQQLHFKAKTGGETGLYVMSFSQRVSTRRSKTVSGGRLFLLLGPNFHGQECEDGEITPGGLVSVNPKRFLSTTYIRLQVIQIYRRS